MLIVRLSLQAELESKESSFYMTQYNTNNIYRITASIKLGKFASRRELWKDHVSGKERYDVFFCKNSYYRYKPLNPNYDVLLKSEPRGKIKSQNGFL